MPEIKTPRVMPKYSVRLAVRKDKLNQMGYVPVFLDVRINKKRERINIECPVPLKNWNKDRQRVTVGGSLTAEDADNLNSILANELNKVTAIFTEYRLKGNELTGNVLRHLLKTGSGNNNCFHKWVQARIESLVGIRNKRVIQHYKVTFRRLKDFRPTLQYYDLNTELPQEFDNYLIKTCGLEKVNTRAKYHKHLKTFTRALARQNGVNIPNVYEHFKIRQVKSKRTFLTKEEVARLVELYDSETLSPHIQKALMRFLFSCHCGGLRCADLNRISWNNLEDGYLCFFPEKTQHIDKLIEVPLSKAAIRFIQNPNGNMFDRLSNQKYNAYLKVVQRVAGLSKTLTTHVARHTFATNYLVAGGRREVLQRILGHADAETTEIYVHTTRQHINQDLHVLGQMYQFGHAQKSDLQHQNSK